MTLKELPDFFFPNFYGVLCITLFRSYVNFPSSVFASLLFCFFYKKLCFFLSSKDSAPAFFI